MKNTHCIVRVSTAGLLLAMLLLIGWMARPAISDTATTSGTTRGTTTTPASVALSTLDQYTVQGWVDPATKALNANNTATAYTLYSTQLNQIPEHPTAIAVRRRLGLSTQPTKVWMSTSEGCTLSLVDMPRRGHLVLHTDTPCNSWFMGTLNNLPTDAPLTIGFYDEPEGQPWDGLKPLVTYADPTNPATFECFRKDSAGHWISQDVWKTGEAADAGSGPTPEQTLMSEDLAAQCLSLDGKSWCAWQNLPVIETTPGPRKHIARITTQFAASTATVAMRYPFTNQYLQAYVQQLQAMQYPGLTVQNICTTPGGLPLPLIKYEPSPSTPNRPTILVYAREWATEPEGDWAMVGMIRWLLSNNPQAVTSRQSCNWLFIPIVDPDGVATGTGRDNWFYRPDPVMPEAVAITDALLQWLKSGHRIDLAVSLKNADGVGTLPAFDAWWPDADRMSEVTTYLGPLFSAVAAKGYDVGGGLRAVQQVQYGNIDRLGGWCGRASFATYITVRTQSRSAGHELSLPELETLGGIIGRSISQTLLSDAAAPLRARVTQFLTQRTQRMATWWQQVHRTEATRTTIDRFEHAY